MMRFRTTSVATAIVMCLGSVIPVQALQMPTVQTTQANNLPLVKVQHQSGREMGRDRNGNIIIMRQGSSPRWDRSDRRDRWDSRDRYNNRDR